LLRLSLMAVTWWRTQMLLLSAQAMDVAAIAKVTLTSQDVGLRLGCARRGRGRPGVYVLHKNAAAMPIIILGIPQDSIGNGLQRYVVT